jgi:FkbM family methyltransferase
MMVRNITKKFLRKLGYVVSRYDFRNDFSEVRKRFLDSFGINLVFDIGANQGQFAKQLRTKGYKGRIVSFEPLSEAFGRLSEHARKDHLWEAVHCALGGNKGKAEINISANSWSSSLLDILPAHINSTPESSYIGKEEIDVRTIDSVISDYLLPDDKLFLKIDTQGFTQQVLNGAERSMDLVIGVQLEMSLVPLYKDEPLIDEIISFLYGKGFILMSIEPEYFDTNTGQLLQVNGLLSRSLYKHR